MVVFLGGALVVIFKVVRVDPDAKTARVNVVVQEVILKRLSVATIVKVLVVIMTITIWAVWDQREGARVGGASVLLWWASRSIEEVGSAYVRRQGGRRGQGHAGSGAVVYASGCPPIYPV
jgi:hypothetical protein